ncbi:hypothetical protein CPAV1605_83 [seawater metagenome]|uniref:Uncharacterized protein n=1 Tax=seawater metagenome TaxID=1561972 RepID=A0A5E8CGQ4_9ZZZZ
MKGSIDTFDGMLEIVDRMQTRINKMKEINNKTKLSDFPKKNYRKNSEIHNLLDRVYKNRQNIKNLDDNDTALNELNLESYQSIYYSLAINIYWYGQFLNNYNKNKDPYYQKELFYYNDSKEVKNICQVAKATMILNGLELEDEDEYFMDF